MAVANTMTTNNRILMIDDDEDHLRLCKLILQRKGYEVMTLSQVKEIGVIHEFKPGLIFIDHYMQDNSGTEVTRMIKSDPFLKDIPVIYFSSCDDIAKRAEEAGADAYLEKPFHFDRLIEITRKFLYS